MSNIEQARGAWSSKLGFVVVAAGSAIGLGNIWRFLYVADENGGAAFVFVYILCVDRLTGIVFRRNYLW